MKIERSDRPGLRLKALEVPGFPTPIELRAGHLTLGRAEDNDVTLVADVWPSVSTHHARLELVDGELWIEDLGSKNGTLVNGKRIRRQRLAAGDVVRLGSIGPRFFVLGGGGLTETVFVDPKTIGLREGDVSADTIAEIVRERTRRNVVGGVLALLLLATAFVLWGRRLSRHGEEERELLGAKLAQAELAYVARLAEAQLVIDDLRQREERNTSTLQAREAAYTQELSELRASRDEQRTRLAELENSSVESAAAQAEMAALRISLDETRGQLVDAQQRVESLEQVNIEQSNLSGVARVREACVLIETRMALVHEDTGKVLFVESTPLGDRPNFDGVGEPFTLEATGSGFVLDEHGWILTNAHVVRAPSDHPVLEILRDLPLDTTFEVSAVFSGTSQRLPVDDIRMSDGGVDLALCKIEPFEGMPHLDGFTTDEPPPEPGSDIYLLGFPLGNFAVQEGLTVIASTFRGILSRVVDGTIQVDAGVHPGNSGGPITDPRGHVLGVVVSVQAAPDRSVVYTIGYGIPIARAGLLWPPREPADAEAGGDAASADEDGDE
jgi:S1-C subfamily serine protease